MSRKTNTVIIIVVSVIAGVVLLYLAYSEITELLSYIIVNGLGQD